MLNVKQPWAWALVEGYKNVENRNHHLTIPLPTWVIIVASKSKPTHKALKDLRGRLKKGTKVPATFPLGSIVGLVRFVSSTDTHKSIWYNGGTDKAWEVGEALRFSPIENIKGCQTPNRLLATHPQKKKIIQALRVRLNSIARDQFIKLLDQLKDLMKMKGEHFRARAYQKAMETLMINPITPMKNLPNIGDGILKKFKQFQETGKIKMLEDAKKNPMLVFTKIYGVGFKKAQALVNDYQITTISELRKKQDEVLNKVQKKGLKHFEDTQLRIKRAEIDEYKVLLEQIFKQMKPGSSFNIVGSYRRGNVTSGDIDIIITNNENNAAIFGEFLNALKKNGIITETFSKGKIKSLTMGQIKNYPARRLDFMYSPPNEYAFAILYFTGSKAFNVLMRSRALSLGYTLNEHGFHKMNGKKKGEKLNILFHSEESIFKFLGMVYKTPRQRIDGRAVQES